MEQPSQLGEEEVVERIAIMRRSDLWLNLSMFAALAVCVSVSLSFYSDHPIVLCISVAAIALAFFLVQEFIYPLSCPNCKVRLSGRGYRVPSGTLFSSRCYGCKVAFENPAKGMNGPADGCND
jgi:membrane protein YdbS with pleckstrin-like domain